MGEASKTLLSAIADRWRAATAAGRGVRHAASRARASWRAAVSDHPTCAAH